MSEATTSFGTLRSGARTGYVAFLAGADFLSTFAAPVTDLETTARVHSTLRRS